MSQQTTRTFIVTMLAVFIFGAIAYNGFFLMLGQMLKSLP